MFIQRPFRPHFPFKIKHLRMARTISPAQRQAEIDAVQGVLDSHEWLRPSAIAAKTGLKTAVVLSVLREVGADRREFLMPRLHHGATRTRKTSRLIVEYRTAPPLDVSLFPSFLLYPSKEMKWQHAD